MNQAIKGRQHLKSYALNKHPPGLLPCKKWVNNSMTI